MDGFWIVFFGAVVAARASRLRPNAILTEVQRTSYRWRLPLSWSVHADAVARTRRIALGDAIGAAAGTALGMTVTVLSGTTEYPYPLVIGFWLGMATGSSIAAATQVPTRAPGARITHARAVTIDDLQPRWLTAVTWLVPAAATATVTWSALDGIGPRDGQALVMLAATLTALACFAVVAKQAVAAPRDAATDLELAWQDGFVARAVVEVATATIACGLTAVLLLALEPGSTLGLPLVIAACAVGAAALLPQPQRTFRRRLWNDREFGLEPADLVAPGTAGRTPA